MSSTESTHPDPGVVPQTSSEVNKGQVDPVKPSQTPGLAKLPADVKTTISKADAIILRLSKLIKTTAGLGAALSTLNYSIYLAAYLHAQSPTRAAVVAHIGRFLGRSTRSKVLPPSTLAPATSTGSFLTPLGSLLSDTRTSLRLTGLIPLYIWLKSLTSNKGQMDPSLRRVALLQCSGYITFQLLENIYHLAGKGVVPMTLIEKRGGINTWVRWSCRAWLVGVASDYLRLWREAQIEKEKESSTTTFTYNKTAREKEDFDRKWWNEFMVATYWLPVAVHYSLYPEGIKGFNTGLVGFFGLMAGLNNFRNQWAATA